MSMGTGGIFGNTRIKRDAFGKPIPTYDDMTTGIPGLKPMGGDYTSASFEDPQPRKKGGLGFRDVVGIIGDGLAGVVGGQPFYTMSKMQQRQDAAEEQRLLRQRQWQLEDARMKGPSYTGIQAEIYAAGKDPNSPEGQAMAMTALQRKLEAPPITQRNPDGTLTIIPAGMVPRGAPSGLPPVGSTMPDPRKAMGNVPPPQLGDNGLPNTMTRQQYMAVVQSMGQPATDAFIQRNRIQVTN